MSNSGAHGLAVSGDDGLLERHHLFAAGLVLAGAGGFAGSALLVSRAAAEAAVADSIIISLSLLIK